jgi:hypothetical protein
MDAVPIYNIGEINLIFGVCEDNMGIFFSDIYTLYLQYHGSLSNSEILNFTGPPDFAG